MAKVDNYDFLMSEADQKYIQSLREQAAATGEWETLHNLAEEKRAEYGYSGGSDGSQYIKLNQNPVGKDKSNKPTFDYDTMLASKPSYTSQYGDRIDAMLDQLLNRDKFSYDAESDPLFQQYKTQYRREGNRAMNDTLAAAAINAGGMSSNAITAAQQANDYYNAKLTDKIPELYQLAYEMYLDDIDLQVQDLGLLQDMDDSQYGRYRDTMSDWYNDLNFAYGQYRDNMGDWQWQQDFDESVRQWQETFDYGKERDAIADSRYDTEWAHQVAQDALAQSNWEKEFDYNASRDKVADSQWEKEYALAAAKQAASNSGGSGYTGSKSSGSKSSGTKSSGNTTKNSGYTGKTTYRNETTGKDAGDVKGTSSSLTIDQASVLALGYGPISMARLDELVESGAVTEYTEGNKIKFKKNTSNVSWPSPFNWNY